VRAQRRLHRARLRVAERAARVQLARAPVRLARRAAVTPRAFVP